MQAVPRSGLPAIHRVAIRLGVLVVLLSGGLMPVSAQKPPAPPPGAVTALMHCAPWQPDALPNPTLAPPTDLDADLEMLERGAVRLTWEDHAENETCYAVLGTRPPEYAPSPALRTAVLIVALPNTTEVTVPSSPPGRSCFQVYAGNVDGRSVLSNSVCVDMPTPLMPPPLPPQPPADRELPPRDAPLVTGIPGVDAVIDAVRVADIEALVARVHYTDLACISEPQGIGAPPLCSSLGQPSGSVVALLPRIVSHLEYRPWWEVPEVFRRWVAGNGPEFAGVLDPAYPWLAAPDNPWPTPELTVVFRGSRGPAEGLADRAFAFFLRNGQIVAVQGFGTGAATLPPPDDPTWLIPPPTDIRGATEEQPAPSSEGPTAGPTPPPSTLAVSGLFADPRPLGSVTRVVPPVAAASPFAPVQGDTVVLFDIITQRATDLGPGSLPSFSPDGAKVAWVAGADSSFGVDGEVKVMDLAGGQITTVGRGRSARFLDADHLTFFTRGNEKVSLDLRTGTTTPVSGQRDNAGFFERLDAARSTTPDGFRITRSPDPQGAPLPRGGATSSLMRVIDTRTGAAVREFQAFAAVPAGHGAVAVATPVQGDTVNIFLVDLATGRAQFLATTRWSAPNFPFAADDARVIWVDNYCGARPGNLFVYERDKGQLVEVDTGGDAWWVQLTPAGQIARGDFGADALLDPSTFETAVELPPRTGSVTGGSDIAWSPDYRYAAYGISGGHGGLC